MPQVITPMWSAPEGVFAASSTRLGGCSTGAFASLNIGAHVGDQRQMVETNRQSLGEYLGLPASPLWLQQVHGDELYYAHAPTADSLSVTALSPPVADAAWTDQPHTVLAVMTADCLPVLIASRCGRIIAAVHGGWRGLAAGILQKTVTMLPVPATELVAWMGPAIGPNHFEVGAEVRAAFIDQSAEFTGCFQPSQTNSNKYYANIFSIAQLCFYQIGVETVESERICTFSDADRFFSHRRDSGQSGRMVTLIWRQ